MMDAQFVSACLEAATERRRFSRVEAYAIGLAIAHEINRDLLEYRIESEGAIAFRVSANVDAARVTRGDGSTFTLCAVEDYVWVQIEGSNRHNANVYVNLAGQPVDLATDYPHSRDEQSVGWLDIPQFIERSILDLIALRQEVAV